MREIKFRAWDKTFKKMVAGPHVLSEGVWISYHYDPPSRGELEYQGFEVMQYTGLKDKNGVPIFEGDVIISEKKSPQAVKSLIDFWALDMKDEIMPEGSLNTIEVLGNIYEHPELLKEKVPA